MPAATLADYLAAREGAVFHRPLAAGFLRLTGDDRLDFLQRQTTNDLRHLTPTRAVTTVLTSPTARILDVLTLLDLGDHLTAITLDDRAARTARELRGKIFFMDRVTITDASAEVIQIDLEGPAAGQILAKLGAEAPGLGEMSVLELVESKLYLIGHPGLIGIGFRLITPASAADQVLTTLHQAGVVELTPVSYETLRIEAGLPGPAAELTDDYNPLEANLHAAISEHKGCYTGQEIIARQLTYDKVTKRLVGLKLATLVAPGAPILADDKAVGEITSVADSPRLGPIALAYLKRPYNEPGATLGVTSLGGITTAVISPLPFPDS